MQKHTRLLFCSYDLGQATQLSGLLGGIGVLLRENPQPQAVCDWVRAQQPHLILLDFMAQGEDAAARNGSAVAQALAQQAPAIPVVAICRYDQPQGAVAALRCGVREIVDANDPQMLIGTIERLLRAPQAGQAAGKRRGALLLGARAGMGVSTLAVHMAALWQERLTARVPATGARPQGGEPQAVAEVALEHRVGILDLGMPVGDCQLYLNITGDFHFVDAARSLRRLDSTLLRSALAHDLRGVSVLPWPRDLQQVHDVSHADSLLLYERLREQFGVLLTDVGGFSNPQFVTSMVQSADSVVVVVDQSVGALVSLSDMLRDFSRFSAPAEPIGLVVNRYDERYGMSAQQIAERFGLVLRGVLPDRTLPLRVSMNQGSLLQVQARRDPYVRAVEALIDTLETHMSANDVHAQPANRPWYASWWPGVTGRTDNRGRQP